MTHGQQVQGCLPGNLLQQTRNRFLSPNRLPSSTTHFPVALSSAHAVAEQQCLGVTVLHHTESKRSNSSGTDGLVQQGRALKHEIKKGRDRSCCIRCSVNMPFLLYFFLQLALQLSIEIKVGNLQWPVQSSNLCCFCTYIYCTYTNTIQILGHSLSASYYSYKTERRVWLGSKIKENQESIYKYENIKEKREQCHADPLSPVRATSLSWQQVQGESIQADTFLLPSCGTTIYIPFSMYCI